MISTIYNLQLTTALYFITGSLMNLSNFHKKRKIGP